MKLDKLKNMALKGPQKIIGFFWYLSFCQTTMLTTFLPNIIPLYKNALYPICLLYDQCCLSVLVIFAYI